MHDAADDIIALYQRHARAFATARAGAPGQGLMEAQWLQRFCDVAGPSGDILDIGCGMAQPISQYFIARGYRVTGVDSSPDLIAMCRSQFPDQRWLVADMRGLDLAATFNGVLAWDSFFHLTPDHQRAMFARFAKLAAPGAALMFTSGPANGVAMGVFEGDLLYHASLAPEAYRILLATHGFEVIAHRAEDPDCGGRTVWLAKRQAA